MSDPLNPSDRQKRETSFANETRYGDPGSPSWSDDQYSPEHYLVPEEDVPVVHQERLFSRRVLFGWAFATLIVVFAVTVILPMVAPIVKETVIERVVGRMQERGMNVRVNGHPVAPAIPDVPPIPAAPVVPAEPAAPDVPAIAGETAPAHRASPATAPAPPTPASPRHTKTPAPATADRR